MGAALATLGFVPDAGVPIGLLAYQGVYAFRSVIFDVRLQAMITSRARATVTSVQGFIVELAAIATFLMFGYVAGEWSTGTAASVLGAVLVLVSAAFAVRARGSAQGSTRPGR